MGIKRVYNEFRRTWKKLGPREAVGGAFRYLGHTVRTRVKGGINLRGHRKDGKVEKGLVRKKIHGNEMLLKVDDPGISRELLADGTREPVHTKIFKEELKEGMTHIDIGASVGYYALLAASLVGDSGKVICLEPVEKNVDLLKKCLDINGFENVEIYKKALSSSDSGVKFKKSQMLNRGEVVEDDEEGSESVDSTTLDSLLDEIGDVNPDSIRMDIEGHEYEALLGMKETLENATSPCNIFMELHPTKFSNTKETLEEILGILKERGFKPDKIGDNSFTNSFTYGLFKEEYQELKGDGSDFIKEAMKNGICPFILFKK